MLLIFVFVMTPTKQHSRNGIFSSHQHTQSLLTNQSLHTLLQTDESLALSIRLLDSTMQTLVYENYSKFIDATDAIRNIGRSVDVSQCGLARLGRGVERMEREVLEMDGRLRRVRSEVAEKGRVKRLLERLRGLVGLPTRLEGLIGGGSSSSLGGGGGEGGRRAV